MTRLDKVRFSIPIEAMKHKADLSFEPVLYQRGNVSKTRLELLDRIVGINTIQIRPTDVLIDVSAKILGHKYREMINTETFTGMIDRINNSGAIEINPGMTYKSALVYACDVTKDIRVSAPVGEYIKALALCQLNPRYRQNVYKGKESVVFTKGRNNQTRLTIYDKHAEIIKDKGFIDHLNQDGSALTLIDSFRSVLRVEQNLRDFEMMRKACGLDQHARVGLRDVLESDTRVLHRTFEDITQGVKPSMIADIALESPSIGVVARRMGYHSILQSCGGDMEKVKLLAMTKSRTPLSTYQRRHLKDAAVQQLEANGKALALIDEVRLSLAEGCQ